MEEFGGFFFFPFNPTLLSVFKPRWIHFFLSSLRVHEQIIRELTDDKTKQQIHRLSFLLSVSPWYIPLSFSFSLSPFHSPILAPLHFSLWWICYLSVILLPSFSPPLLFPLSVLLWCDYSNPLLHLLFVCRSPSQGQNLQNNLILDIIILDGISLHHKWSVETLQLASQFPLTKDICSGDMLINEIILNLLQIMASYGA